MTLLCMWPETNGSLCSNRPGGWDEVNTIWRKTLTVEKSDKFDEWMLNYVSKNFPRNFALNNFWYCIFYGYND